MLETDAKIPVEPVPIRPPVCYSLGGTALAVKQMRDAGAGVGQIYHKLRISEDAYRDAIFEIRKQEGIENMARGTKTDPEKIAQVLALRDEGKTMRGIAEETGIPAGTVQSIIAKQKPEAEPVTEPDGEWIAVEETAAEPEPMPVPDAVFDAVAEKLADIERKIETNEAHIRTIQNQNEFLRERMNELQTWVEAVR